MPAEPETDDPTRDERYDIVREGVELEAAKKSAFYRFILATAAQEASKAYSALVDCDPTDVARIVTLQGTIRRYEDLEGWLDSAIEQAIEMYETLRDEEEVARE